MKQSKPLAGQIVFYCFVVSLPFYLIALAALYHTSLSRSLVILVAFLGALLMAWCHHKIHEILLSRMSSLSSALVALARGEYTMLAPTVQGDEVLGEVIASINSLAINLRSKRWDSVESQLLFNMVIDHIDVAILALDNKNRVVFANRFASRLFKIHDHVIRGQEIPALSGIHSLPSGEHTTLSLKPGGHESRYRLRIEDFRESGQHRRLLFITDVSAMLRREEAKSWQKLVRVMSHEINNSLTPIASISETLKALALDQSGDRSLQADIVEGLEIIRGRANALGEFMQRYKEVTKIPEPVKKLISLQDIIAKIRPLFAQMVIKTPKNTDIKALADPVQMEQVLINIAKNSQEAMKELAPNGELIISWEKHQKFILISLRDQGKGISNPGNLFTPFYSTKKTGSGIGLVFCRQVIKAHGGELTIRNGEESGCCAIIELPFH